MANVVYIDESGNEGDVAGYLNPFDAQPSFVLAGIVENAGSGATERLLQDLRSKYRFQANDLKWKSFSRRPKALADLVRGLKAVGVTPFVELMDKRHYVANNIVTYVLGDRRLDFLDAKVCSMARIFADALASDIGDSALLAYTRLAKAPCRESFDAFVVTLRAGIHEGMDRSVLRGMPERWTILSLMDELLTDVVAFWCDSCAGDDVSCFVPDPDSSLGGHRLGLLPHVSAFGNLCGRLNAFLKMSDDIQIVHDEQNEFGGVMGMYLTLLSSNECARELADLAAHADSRVDWAFAPNKFQLSFANSERTAGVQVADVLAGFCRSRLDTVIAKGRPSEGFDAIARELADIPPPAGLLFLTTAERVKAFRAES